MINIYLHGILNLTIIVFIYNIFNEYKLVYIYIYIYVKMKI